MMKKRVVITRNLPIVAFDVLSKHFDVSMSAEDEPLSKTTLIDLVASHDGILSTVSDNLSSEVLSHATSLEAISNYASGVDNIDVAYAEEHGISVYGTKESVVDSTADYTFALLLSLIRKTSQADMHVREGMWESAWDPNLLLGEELAGKTLGIIGFGRVGRAVAKRAEGFGLKVVAFNPSTIDGAKQVSFATLLKSSDYISIHAPLNYSTRGMLRSTEFSKMDKHPIILNMARGKIVDTEALVKALKSGKLRGAALDVMDPEPLSMEHELCKMSNVILSPHVGTATVECREKMAVEAANNLVRHFNEA